MLLPGEHQSIAVTGVWRRAQPERCASRRDQRGSDQHSSAGCRRAATIRVCRRLKPIGSSRRSQQRRYGPVSAGHQSADPEALPELAFWADEPAAVKRHLT